MLSPTSYVRRRSGCVSGANLLWGQAGIAPAGPQRGRSAAQNAGLRFEARVSAQLTERYPGFLQQVPFHFVGDHAREKCILDGMLFWHPKMCNHEMLLIEMKKRHTADAWFQLRYLYYPVVKYCFPSYNLRLLEICKEFEIGVSLPEPYALHRNVEDFILNGASFGVVCWR